MRGNPNYAGVNPDRHQLPAEFWSKEDWEAEDALQQPLDTKPLIAPPAPTLAAGWFMERPRHQDARSRGIDDVLDRPGIRPRRADDTTLDARHSRVELGLSGRGN